MTAAACATTRLNGGTLVFANDFRHPAILAKEATTIDILSGGRLEFGLGTGWMAHDYPAGRAGAGLAGHPDRAARRGHRRAQGPVGRRLLLVRREVLHDRRHGPDPEARPAAKLMLGGGGPKMLALAAREADVINLTMRVKADGTGPDTADSGPDASAAR